MYFRVFLSLVLVQLPCVLLFAEISPETRRRGEILAQDLQVSIAGTPVSSGSNQSFGNVNLLATSSAVTITLDNPGDEDLNITSITLTGAHTSDFILNTSGLTTLLIPNATTSFTISFAPTLSGTRNAAIQIDSNDPDTPFIINLEGEGIKLNQSITFNALADKTYGDASFSLGATASSGLPVSYASSNPLVATISGSTITIEGAGSTTITASQAGDVTYNAASDVMQSLTVNKVSLTVTAENKARFYGEANPAFTFFYSGFVLGETSANLDALPSGSTPADGSSSVGTYDIIPTGGSDTNYSFSFVNGTLTINKATPAITWNDPAPIVYGTPLSVTQLNALTPVIGSFSYNHLLGTVLNAGINQPLIAEFIPADQTNYENVTGTTVSLIVNQAPLTATADDKSKVFNEVNPSLTITYTGFVNGDNVSALNGAPSISTTAATNSPVGSYPITLTGGADDNYALTNVNGTLSISQATPVIIWANPAAITYGTPLSGTQLNASANVAGTFTYQQPAGTFLNAGTDQTLSVGFVPDDPANYNPVAVTSVLITVNKANLIATAENKTRVYNTTNPVFTIAYSGFVNGDDASDLNIPPTASTVAIATTSVGPYAITLSLEVDNNYNISTVDGVLTITKATPIVTWLPPAAITYGTLLSGIQLNASASVSGSYNYSPTAGELMNAGVNQTLSLNFIPTDAVNYESVNTSVSITVNKATLTATADNKTRLYGAANPAFTITYTGFVNGETVAVINALPTASSAAVATTPVGSEPILLTGGLDDNYEIDNISGTLTITKAMLTVTANNQSRAYGAVDPTYTLSYSGFVNSETVSVLATPPTGSSIAIFTSPVGTYPIVAGGGLDNNYDFTYAAGTLTITKALITATANNQSRTYGSANPVLTINYSGFVNGETVTVINTLPIASTVVDLLSNAGSYTITVIGGTDDNYDFTYVSGSLTITKATLSVIANNQSRTYGAADPAFTLTYSGFLNGETATVIDSAPLATSVVIGTTPVGSYPITVSGGSDDNYAFVYTSGTIAITKATVTAIAVDASRVYGSANPVFSIIYSGLLNGETAAVLDVVPSTSSLAVQASPVGTYAISVAGGSDDNYNFLYTSGTITITKATVTATVSNANRVYGVINPVFPISYSGFVNGETVTVLDVTPTVVTTAILTSSVGSYPITVSGGSDNNYLFNYVNATLTITKATPVVSWSNPLAITYGTPLSATQLNATATVAGTYIYTPAVNAILNAGAGQVLTVNFTPTDLTNYNVVNGTTAVIEVTKSSLTVIANNQSRTYGAGNPVFTVSYSGFLNGETAIVIESPPTATSAVNATTPVGAYPIVPSGGSDNNYDFVYSEGTISITKATVTAIAVDASRLYGSANPVFTITYAGLLNGETSAVLDVTPTASSSATLTSPAGPYDITVIGGSDNNYNFLYTSGTLTISKATVTATVFNASRVYGVANPTFPITYSGFVNAETFAVLDVTPTAISSANLTSAVGSYPITVSGGSDNNYLFSYVNATLAITKATPVVIWSNPAAITYGTPLSATQLNATANVAGTFSYTPASGTILNAGTNQVLSANFTPADITNYNAVNGTTVSITVNKANPVITWANPLSITFGTALSATQLNATASVAGSFIYTPPNGTILNAGAGQVLSANFTPTDGGNYNPVNGTTVLITVNKATPVVSWSNPAPITYGTALSATQLNATASVPGSFVYAPGLGTILNAGMNQSLSVNFTPTDAVNYSNVNGTTVLITVNKATPVVSWSNPAAITYGTALSASQLNATATVPGTFAYTPPAGTVLNAGVNQLLTVNFTPSNTTNFNNVNGTTVVITVNKATPVITWPTPAAITYGTALSATQLNATSSVAGVFVYTPTAGTLLNAGTNQVLSVDFTPTDAANYNAINNIQRLITVNKANPVITWANPSAIVYGTPLSSTQLNATSNVPGAFTYTPAAGMVLNVGDNQNLSLNFIPTDAANFNSILGRTALITVTKATPVVSWSTPLPIKINEALTSTQLNATANVPGTFVYSPSAGTSYATVGTYTLTVSFTPTDAANYSSVPSTQVQIAVNNKDNPVVTWNNPAAITYGTRLSATQLNATANVPGTFVYTPAINSLLNAGVDQTLSVNFIPTDAINYNSVNRNVQITVNKAVVTATAVSTSRLYGSANPAFTINYTGFVNSENASVLDTSPTASCSAIAGDNAGGVFPIIPAGGVDNNYTFNFVNGSLTITKAPLLARADDKSRSYGLANPAFTISYTGFVNGDTESEVTSPSVTTTATSLSNVGSYPITLAGGTSINYNFALQNGTLTINTSPLIAKASDLTKTYGQTNPTLTIVYTGFLNGDNATSITQPSVTTAVNQTTAVGMYPITLSGGSALNYGIILQPGTMTINKATLSVTATNQTKSYGANNPTLSFTYLGFVNGETAVVIDSPPLVTTTANVLSPVGTYTINISGGSDNNYAFNFTSGTLSVTKATLTATVANATRIYGASNPVFVINYSGFLNGDNESVIDVAPVPATSATVTSSVGTYSINGAGGSDNNYSFNYVAGTLTILKATITATASNATRSYGSANPTFVISYTGFVNGESANVIDTPPTATTTAIVASPIGTYPITVSGGLDNNYLFTYVNGVLTITKASPVITWNNPAAIAYGTPLSGTQLNASASVAGTFTYVPASGTILNAGANQVLSANFVPTDGTNYNSVAGTTVLITVNKATPTITWSTPATITYGTTLSAAQLNATASVAGTFSYTPPAGSILDAGPNQTLSVSFTPTNVNYNSVEGTTVQITVNKATPVINWPAPAAITYGTALSSTQLNASSTVPGTYTYTPAAGTILNAGANQNLSVNFIPTNTANYNAVNGITTQITVNKATPIITWPTPAQIVFGTTLSGTQLNATANTSGTFVYTPASGTILNVGANQILSVNFTPTNTANFNSVLGTTVLISVVKSFPVITWSNPTAISYGTPLGVNQLNATANVPGTFTYTPAVGTILNAGVNQTLSVDFTPANTLDYGSVNGTTVLLNVNKINLTATANDLSRTYGAANPALTINYTGFVNGEIETALDTAPGATTTADVISSVGSYPISVSGGGDNNYDFSYVSGSLTITKASLTATANDLTRLLGAPNPPLTISYSGFLNGDDVSDLDVTPLASTPANTSSPVGGYPITLAGGSDNNYNFTYAQGTLTITPNFPPVITSFNIETPEDIRFNFSYSTFGANFTSFSGSPIIYIKIVSLPTNGVLFWKGTAVAAGAEIIVENGSIQNFFYLPNANFSGTDLFRWNASEGTFLAVQDATLSIRITKVNDAPVLSNIETTPILYSLGDPAIAMTRTTVINDVDDNFIYSAKISITENFTSGDLLSLGTGVSVSITPSVNGTTGELELTGRDSRANYELALAKVLFSSPVTGSATVSDKRVSIIVKDSLNNSNTISRIVSITEVFPELSIVNSFTPNGDNVNDFWDFVNLDFYSNINISVFDRNGRLVYNCKTKDCKWDGKFNGLELPAGTYLYTIYLNDGKRKYQGDVTILR
jgi:gliding motility-associated-like protein